MKLSVIILPLCLFVSSSMAGIHSGHFDELHDFNLGFHGGFDEGHHFGHYGHGHEVSMERIDLESGHHVSGPLTRLSKPVKIAARKPKSSKKPMRVKSMAQKEEKMRKEKMEEMMEEKMKKAMMEELSSMGSMGSLDFSEDEFSFW